MAAILTIASGFLGLIVALVSLLLGGGMLTALLLWASVGISSTCLGLVLSLIPLTSPARA
jgi:hypothetical protein